MLSWGKASSAKWWKNRRYMRGELDLKILKERTEDEKRDVALLKPHNFLCNPAPNMIKIKGISLPENMSSFEEFKVEELKSIVIWRGEGFQ